MDTRLSPRAAARPRPVPGRGLAEGWAVTAGEPTRSPPADGQRSVGGVAVAGELAGCEEPAYRGRRRCRIRRGRGKQSWRVEMTNTLATGRQSSRIPRQRTRSHSSRSQAEVTRLMGLLLSLLCRARTTKREAREHVVAFGFARVHPTRRRSASVHLRAYPGRVGQRAPICESGPHPAVAPGTPRTVSAPAGDVSGRVEAGIPVQVLLGIAGRMLVQPHDRCIGVPARNQHPSDVVRLDAGEVWAHTLRCSGATEDSGQELQCFLKITAFVAPSAEHPHQCRFRTMYPLYPQTHSADAARLMCRPSVPRPCHAEVASSECALPAPVRSSRFDPEQTPKKKKKKKPRRRAVCQVQRFANRLRRSSRPSGRCRIHGCPGGCTRVGGRAHGADR